MRPFIVFFAGAALVVSGALAQSPSRSIDLLDRDWQFDPLPDFALWPSEAVLTDAQIAQLHCPSSDAAWQTVHLPDDYVVRGEFSARANPSLRAQGAVGALGGREFEIPHGAPKGDGRPGALDRPGRDAYAGHGYLPVYPAWYRRSFDLPVSDRGRSVWLDFGGVYRDAVVFVNGRFIAQHPSGYTGFRLNVTSAIRFGAPNEIAVFVDPRWFEGWWYEGGGIYRHVRLIVTDPLQVTPWGAFVDAQVPGTIKHNTPTGDRADARLSIRTTVRNDHAESRAFTLESVVVDAEGKTVAAVSTPEELGGGQELTFNQDADLPEARLWSLEHPNLYRLRTVLRGADAEADRDSTDFGVRTLRFDPREGFFLNGRHVEIRGFCSHQDFPGVGIAAPDNLWAWRIDKLKEMGANGYRCAHNPDSEAFYDDADRMGMLVMDETRHFGDTYFPKATASTGVADLSDVKAMVLQHRNHPSIIMWSLANEEGQGPKPHGAQIYAATKAAVKAIDPTRPVTGAVNGGYVKTGYIPIEDILGMNYHNPEFDRVHAEFPDLMIFGSEDGNAKSSRGTLTTDRSSGRCSEFGDGPVAGSLGGQPWVSWAPTIEHRYVAGQFAWTGFDYRGEPNPFSWPAVTSQTGAMDLCGFAKPAYYYWRSQWQDAPTIYLTPGWDFPPAMAGKPVRVRVYSNCERVELQLNGRSLGSQPMPAHHYLEWTVPYEPGVLKASGYNGSALAASDQAATAGAAVGLRLTVEVPRLAADGESIAPVRVEVVDAHGEVVSGADSTISFSATGAGSLAGSANGDPTSHESNVGRQRTAFHGLCLALVRAGAAPGTITLEASAPSLAPARIDIPVR